MDTPYGQRPVAERDTHRFDDDVRRDLVVMATILVVTVVLALFTDLSGFFAVAA